MNRLPAVAACCLLLMAAEVVAADPGAPLESSKQELRKLRDSAKTGQEPDLKEGVKTGVPSLQIPGQTDAPATLLLNPEKLEKQRKAENEREERRNWLVNGVKRLEASEARKEGDRGRTALETESIGPEEQKAGGDDSQSLLKLYEEQKKLDSARQAEAKPSRQTTADPLAPFLQGWLGNSPARGPSFDDFTRKGSAEVSRTQPGTDQLPSGMNGTSARTITPLSDASLSAQPAPNPYLAGPDSPATGNPLLQPRLTVPAPVQIGPMPNPLPGPLPAAPSTMQPESRMPERKPPATPQTEDKKYFPQLNKF